MSLRGLAIVAMLLTAAVFASAPVEASAGDAAHGVCSAGSCDDDCPSDCPPGCSDACVCCLRVRADTAASGPRVPPPLARTVAYVLLAQVPPASADPDERDVVPRAGR